MQTKCLKLPLNESELKSKFFIKECSVIVHPLVISRNSVTSKSVIQPVSELTMNLNTSNDATNEWRAKRKKYISRAMKGKFARGRLRFGKGRVQQKVTQLIKEAQNDGNTSNSENSDGSPLYNEIDWEENLACDSTLVDEFAPIPQNLSSQPTCCSAMLEPSVAIPMIEENDNDFEDLSLAEGAEIFVRFNLANDNPEWLAAVVVEVDQEEEELLIKYTEGNPPPPMEWMNPTSNRIRRARPQQPSLQSDFPISSDVAATSLPSKPDISNTGEVRESLANESTLPPSPQALPSPLPLAEEPPFSTSGTPEPSPTQDHTDEVCDIKPIRPGGSRSRGGWRRKKGALLQRVYHTGSSKFVEGEKVLAKWSDHRMQKFPAVIKSILNGGKYDVLFYDGFEKTISEDHLFKTTEEEMAKYEHMNPSEADSFDHMDLDSKEARRQRKKKTFDDYVFARDYKTKRRVMKNGERFTMQRKLGFQFKGNGDGSLAGGDEGESDKPIRQKRMRRKRRFLVGPKRDSRMKIQITDNQQAPSSSVETTSPTPPSVGQESENFYGFDSDPAVPEIVPKTEPSDDPPPIKTEVSEPSVIKREPTEDRWKPSENQNYKPIEINRDGVTRKSLVVPDNNLLPGWSKHAVVSTTNNLWDVILLSPEGYQINNVEELKEYFDMKNDGESPPASLDFLADFNVLAELALKQRDIPAAPTPKIWRRGGRGGRRGGRGHMSSSARGRTGVRTLLPKCRFQEPSSPVTPMPQPASTNLTENEFRCPKEGCDKKFRKESLLQMHIKHYHRELSTLAHCAPNMVDLACARSESVNSDWKTSTDLPKIPSSTVKKLLPRSFPSSPNVNDELLSKKSDQGPESHLSPNQGNSRVPDRSLPAENPSLKRQPTEERRTTIKTMLPIRPSEIPPKSGLESDEVESEDEYIEQKKNGSRIFKPGKFRRGSRIFSGMRMDDSLGESPSQLPAFKFTKKRKADKSVSDSYDVYHDEDKLSSGVEVNDDGVIIERLKSEEFINCICGFREEDGLMIQCDLCMCWQHGLCSGIENESDVPERYICTICRNPFRVRSAKKYAYAQHYLTQGKLPTFNFRSRNDDEIAHREMILKRCFELTANVLEIKNVDRSLTAKINIAEKADHPKLYMWAKNWEETESKQNSKLSKDLPEGNNGENQSPVTQQPMGPQPEAPIDLEECRIRLLDHVEHGYSQIEDRLTSLQAQIAALESLDPDLSSSTANDKVTKQTIQMLIKDLETLNKLAAIS